ncbi:MAG: hypothetical protein ACTS5Y_06700 [Pollutimonas bauzanensis]
MRKSIFAIAILLGGCASPERLAQLRQQEAYQQQQQDAAYVARLNARCSQFGFTEGSAQHSQCMMSIDQQNRANFGAAAAALIQSQPQAVKPRCSSLPPFIAGVEASRGGCY